MERIGRGSENLGCPSKLCTAIIETLRKDCHEHLRQPFIQFQEKRQCFENHIFTNKIGEI